MVRVECGIIIIDDDVINYAAESGESCEGFSHAAVIVLRDGRYSVWCAEVFESPEWRDEGCQQLAFLIQWALMVTLHGIHHGKDFCIASGDVGDGLGWGE